MPIGLYHKTIKVLSQKQQQLFFVNTFLGLFIALLDISTISVLLYSLHHVYQLQTNSTAANALQWLLNLTDNNIQLYSIAVLSIVFALLLIKNTVALFIYKKHLQFISSVATGFAQQQLNSFFLQPFSNHIETTTGEQIRNTGNLTIEFAQHLVLGFMNIISDSIFLLIAVGGILIYSPTLFALLIITLLPCFLIIQFVSKNKLHQIRKNIKKEHGTALQYLIEAINNYVETKIYQGEKFFINRYTQQQQSINNNLSKLLLMQAIPSRVFELCIVISSMVFFMYQQSLHQLNSSSLLAIGVFIAASLKVVGSFTKIIANISQAKTYSFTLTELEKIQPQTLSINTISNIEVNNNIQVNNLSHYFSNKTPVLNNVQLQFKVGAITGICGASGSGKSTLLNTLTGLIPLQKGKILVDNKTVDFDTQLHSWQQQIAFVKQSFFLIQASIATNITLSENILDENKLDDAIEQSGLTNFIQQQTNGVHTIVQDNGKNISGGEKQRIAIARALYHNRNILILDESLNELDAENVQLIVQQLKQIAAGGKCIIIVSHQPHVLKECDFLYQLTNGNIVQQNLTAKEPHLVYA